MKSPCNCKNQQYGQEYQERNVAYAPFAKHIQCHGFCTEIAVVSGVCQCPSNLPSAVKAKWRIARIALDFGVSQIALCAATVFHLV
ncbi:MAG: hypothetical protein ACFE8Z_05885 [Candidatus Hermodarchaeota archaeon]